MTWDHGLDSRAVESLEKLRAGDDPDDRAFRERPAYLQTIPLEERLTLLREEPQGAF